MIRALALVALLLAASASSGQPDRFVRVENGRFVRNGEPYVFAGANLWYGMNLGSAGEAGDRARLVRELDRLQALGVTNLRVMAASEGPRGEPWRVHPAVQDAPGAYDEALLTGLDVLLAEMAARDMTAVLVLNNFFHWSGGMAQYRSWSTGTPIPYPNDGTHTWDAFQMYAAEFYADPAAQALFEAYLRHVVMRTNTITGVAYRDDATIMAWQLGNEPRGFQHADAYVLWVDRTAALLQTLDPNHLVSLGGEGKLQTGYDVPQTQFERVSRSPNLDYLTIHIWIENWQWYQPATDPEGTFPEALGNALAYLGDHAGIAARLGKPLVVEEFGASRDGLDFRPAAATTYRDTYYRALYQAIYALAAEGLPVAGSNVWSWSGEGRPRTPGASWAPGDPFTGDPPHEAQGWYSIYEGDASTHAVIAAHAAKMRSLTEAP
jgi:mannan endo-1,4-beta-mannosidase